MKDKTMAMIEFTGRETSTGRVFDTTDAETAKQSGLYREDGIFKPIPVIVGNKDVLHGMDDALKEMKVGETRTIVLAPEKAFGERRKDLIVVVPLQEFRKRQIQPMPGLIVDLNGGYGRVQTVSGGRVRVDLNNDLAGKEVEYDIKVLREITDVAEKAEMLTEKFFPLKDKKIETKMEKEDLYVKLSKDIAKQLAPIMPHYIKTMKTAMPELKKIEIVESFEEIGKKKTDEKKVVGEKAEAKEEK